MFSVLTLNFESGMDGRKKIPKMTKIWSTSYYLERFVPEDDRDFGDNDRVNDGRGSELDEHGHVWPSG